MSAREPHIFLTKDAADRITAAPLNSGSLAMTHLPSEDMYVVTVVSTSPNARMQVSIPKAYETLNWSGDLYAGQWLRQPVPHLNLHHLNMLRRPGTLLSFKDFQELVPTVQDPGNGTGFLITHDPEIPKDAQEIGAQVFAGWTIQRDGVRAIGLAVEPEVLGIQQLENQWPIQRLASTTALVVGLGSIGGTAATSLAQFGVGASILVDPDRFLWHNMVRHVLNKESVGRYKVDAMKEHLEQRSPWHVSLSVPLDVATDTHLLRPLLHGVDLIICAADGIAPRRVVSHLARRAGIPAVLACVLDDGGLGEVLRLRPGPNFGCLLCQRAQLAETGAIDAEADQELAYGTGHVHKPMTAIPPDLHLVGTLAAKVGVATLLESLTGDATQRLPGEQAVIGLRPNSDLAAPYNVTRSGEVKWHPVPAPRPNCPTCSAA